jgi:hypothetical protein
MSDRPDDPADLPAHPSRADHDAPSPARRSGQTLIVIAVVVLIAVVIALHLFGVVGPGAHR